MGSESRDIFDRVDDLNENIKDGTNWPLLAFLFLLPLVNIQQKFFPPLPGGINFMNVMFALSLIGAFWKGGRVHWEQSANKWIVAFMVYLVFSYVIMLFMLTLPIERSLNALKDLLFTISLTFLVQKSISSYKDVKLILFALLLPLPYVFRVIFNQYQVVARWNYSDSLRVNGTMVDLGSNEIGAYLVTASVLAVVLAFSFKVEKLWEKALLYIAVPCALLSLMYTYSRGAYVSIIAAAIVFYFYKKNKGKLTVILLLFFVASPLIIPESVYQRFSSISSEDGERDESAESRFVFWEAAFERAKQSPIFGYGYRSWGSSEINSTGMDTHNYFVKTIVEGGVLGILLLIALLISISNLARTTIKNSKSQLMRAVGIVLLCSVIGILVGNMFGDRFSHPPIIFIFWVLCGVCAKLHCLAVPDFNEPVNKPSPSTVFDD
ncbi:MAG: O-antigen ligase family protein [Cellvibrionaceae bacterium]